MDSPTTIFLRGLFGFCPHCGKARIFSGIYAIRDACPVCGLRFANMPGDFTGAAYANSAMTGAVAVLYGFLMVLFTDVSIEVILLLGIPLILLTATLLHQPIRGAWVAFLYYTHAIEPPDEQDFR